jgi:hypothetical protein
VEENQTSYRLEVEALELGFETRAVSVELVTHDTRESVDGSEAAPIWAVIIPALAGAEPWVVDFFAHLGRVRDFCRDHGIGVREPNSHAVIIPAPEQTALSVLIERFAGEKFGIRAGGPALTSEAGQAEAERQIADRLAAKGVDAYEALYADFLFCGICEFETGALTILSKKLWASEVIRRVRPALAKMRVEVTRPG